MDLLTLLSRCQNLPEKGCRIYNLPGSGAALLLSLQADPFVAVEKDEEAASVLRKDIGFYRAVLSGADVRFLPDPNGPENAGMRAQLLFSLAERASIVTSPVNLRSTFWEKGTLLKKMIFVRRGFQIERSLLEEALLDIGYRNVPIVSERGEFSRKGWIVDIFPSISEDPLRMEFFGDEVEQIRTFEIGTQRSTGEIEEFTIFPAAEPDETSDLSSIASGKPFFCLFAPSGDEPLPEETVFLSRFAFSAGPDVRQDGTGPPSPLVEVDAGMLSMRGIGILPDERKGIGDLAGAVAALGRSNRVILVASSEGQADRLKDIFREQDVVLPLVPPHDLVHFTGNVALTIGGLSSGVFVDGLIILTGREIFGERPSYRPIKKSRVSGLVTSLDDIVPGDFIVHRDHGVGRFSGVVRHGASGEQLELLQIDYEDGRLYIPVQNIQVITKFRAEEGIVPKIDRLGGKTWQKKKERARKKANELAAKLLELYAGRSLARGFSFSADSEIHREFDSFFPYEETPDQTAAIAAIKADMESGRPMDRLLCGDVGYGKTEVAMRAAFKAVHDGRQVAVLVPTTILAEQHSRTFGERFSGFPVTIDFVSRFKPQKEIRETLKRLSRGEIDIIVGTHALLSKKIVFDRLGLLIVDEEHRFGVGQKERIKEMSRNVDVLNLTATPIPRTLYMALSGIRDISVIETPPEERLAVKTVVSTFSENLMRDSIGRELDRRGQVFFVHNRISDIYRMGQHLQKLVPEARIAVAHGQMAETELEGIMHQFFGGEVDVLVSTAIIGSGIDIPRANTIIIDRADKMGLADLYQLRGRVGRSNLKGYAYLLIPGENLMTDEAKRRIHAIQEMSYLGAGFKLAMRDLEIRGAGNVFGPEQSGRINEIGFDLYVEMLEKAVAELKGIEIREEKDPVIEMKVSAFIPEEYIGDVTLRISFYRRLSSIRRREEISGIEAEMRDRFGPPPEEVGNLLDIVRLKVLARALSVGAIRDVQGKITISFSPDTPVQPDQMFSLRERRKQRMKFLPEGFELDLRTLPWATICGEVQGALQELQDAAMSQEAGERRDGTLSS